MEAEPALLRERDLPPFAAAVAVLLAWPPVAQRLGVLVDPISSVEASDGPDAEPMPLSTRIEHHPEVTLTRHLPR